MLAFTGLESGIGVRHGWTPLPDSECEITQVNGCFVEAINHKPALDYHMDFITERDPAISRKKKILLENPTMFFEEVAIEYPLGIIRNPHGKKHLIDRTAVSVGADRSLQFSSEIPPGTRARILHIGGKTLQDRCL